MKCEECGHINKAAKPYFLHGITYGCTCPWYLRKEIKHPGDETTFSRTGCLTCNRWDEPPELKK